MVELFTTFVYQPFLNILVGIYWFLGLFPADIQDMGIAVIIFTIIVRIMLIPLSISGERTEKERREISEKYKEIQHAYAEHPIERNKLTKKLLHGNKKVLISEMVTLGIQVMIALMLWRIFAQGLGGKDLHLIYAWMPKIHLPFNLMFLGKYDLTHPHMFLNIIQSLLIAILETLSLVTSPFPVNRQDVIRLQLTLPIVSFLVFMFMPAGKKLFVITALIFSIVFKIIRIGSEWFYHMFNRGVEEKSLDQEKTERPTQSP